jgi:hypothetical protein
MKPCPFCNSKRVQATVVVGFGHAVMCFACQARGPVHDTQQVAEVAWDRDELKAIDVTTSRDAHKQFVVNGRWFTVKIGDNVDFIPNDGGLMSSVECHALKAALNTSVNNLAIWVRRQKDIVPLPAVHADFHVPLNVVKSKISGDVSAKFAHPPTGGEEADEPIVTGAKHDPR